MTKKTSKDSDNSVSSETKKKFSWGLSRQQKFIFGIALLFFSIALLLSLQDLMIKTSYPN